MRVRGRVTSVGSDIGLYKTCPVCKKEFYVRNPELWTFRRSNQKYKDGNASRYYICSDTCGRKWDKEHDRGNRSPKSHGDKSSIVTAEVLEDFLWNKNYPISRMAKELGVTDCTINRYMEIYDIYGEEHRKGRVLEREKKIKKRVSV